MKGGDFMDNKTMKILGMAATVVGIGASLLGSQISEKQQDAKIEEKVLKALASKEKE